MDPASTQPPSRKLQARAPFAVRKAEARRESSVRVSAQIKKPLTAAQKAADPLGHETTSGKRSALAAGWVVAALGLHVVAVLSGFLLGGEHQDFNRDEQEVKIEVREPPPPPPPEPIVEPEPEPEPEVEKPQPKAEKPAPPPQAEPPPPTDTPPPRVVGLSLDSTTEGGGGPAFAVGNTREGQTGKQAADPTKVAPVGAGPIVEQPTETPNRAASRIPTVGLVFTPAKRKVLKKPVYPETLKSQGIEADVTVMLTLTAEGKVANVKIVKGAAHPEFDESSRKSGWEEEYEPAQKNGTPVPTTITFVYRFRLEDS